MVDQRIVDKFMTNSVVAEVREARTPLWDEKTNPTAVYRKAVELVLDDGTTQYGCTWDDCKHVGDSAASVAGGHYKAHGFSPDLRRVPFKDWTLEEILGRLQDTEGDLMKVMAQRDAAERRLDAVKARAKEEVAELKAKVAAMEKELAEVRAAVVKLLGKAGISAS